MSRLYRSFLHRLKGKRLSPGQAAQKQVDLDAESKKRGNVSNMNVEELNYVLEDNIELIQANSYLLETALEESKVPSTLKESTYFSILYRFERRRDFNDAIGKTTRGVTRFLLFLFDDYIKKTEHTSSENIRWFYMQVAMLSYRLYVLAINEIADSGKIGDYIIYYFQSICSIKFAAYIKAIRSYEIRKKISRGTEECNLEILAELNSYSFVDPFQGEYWSLDDYLPEDFLIHWKDESVNDFAYTQEKEVEQDAPLKIFEEAVDAFLLDCNVKELDPIHVECLLGNISESKVMIEDDPDQKTVSVRVAYRKMLEEIKGFKFLSKSPNRYKRCKIFVSPENVRDSWIPDVSTRLRITYFDKLIYQIIKEHPRNAMVDDFNFDKNLSRFINNDRYKIMIDLKKEGLTTPHSLIKIFLEKLDDKYGNNFRYLYNCIKNQIIFDNGTAYTTVRGRGLGMINNMLTAINICVSYILSLDSLFYIDDSIYMLPESVNSLDSANLYLNNIIKVYNGLGFVISTKKSIISKSFVFLEEYYEIERYGLASEKFLRPLLAILCSIFCESFADCKSQIYSYICQEFFSKKFWELFGNVLRYFPSEFKKSPYCMDFEILLPPYLGGYGLCYDKYIDRSLQVIDDLSPLQLTYVSEIVREIKKFHSEYVRKEKNGTHLEVDELYDKVYRYTGTDKNSIYFDLFKMVSKDEKVKNLNENLNMIYSKSRNINHRLRNLNRRKNLFRRNIDPKDKIINLRHKIDIFKEIINLNNELNKERNFAIPKSLVISSREYVLDAVDGEIDYYLPKVYSNEERILSVLYHKGLLDKRPEMFLVKKMWSLLGEIRRPTKFSFNGKVPRDIEDFFTINKRLLPFILTLNATPEFALMDFTFKYNLLVQSVFLGSNFTEYKYYMESNLHRPGVFEYDLQENRIYLPEKFGKLWESLRHKIPAYDRAVMMTLLKNNKYFMNEALKLNQLKSYIVEKYDVEDKELNDLEKLYRSDDIKEVFNLEYHIEFEGLEEDFDDFLDTFEGEVYFNPIYEGLGDLNPPDEDEPDPDYGIPEIYTGEEVLIPFDEEEGDYPDFELDDDGNIILDGTEDN